MKSPPTQHTICVVDQNAFVRRAIRGWIREIYEDTFIVDEVGSHESLVLRDDLEDFELLLIDLDILQKDGLVTYSKMRYLYPNLKVIVMSLQEPLVYQTQKRIPGVTAFVRKLDLQKDLSPILNTYIAEQDLEKS